MPTITKIFGMPNDTFLVAGDGFGCQFKATTPGPMILRVETYRYD